MKRLPPGKSAITFRNVAEFAEPIDGTGNVLGRDDRLRRLNYSSRSGA
jgi:hypothetical protein